VKGYTDVIAFFGAVLAEGRGDVCTALGEEQLSR